MSVPDFHPTQAELERMAHGAGVRGRVAGAGVPRHQGRDGPLLGLADRLHEADGHAAQGRLPHDQHRPVRAVPGWGLVRPAGPADPDHVRRRTARLVPRRRQGAGGVRVQGHDVRDRRKRRAGQPASISTGTSSAAWRTAGAGTCRSTPASSTSRSRTTRRVTRARHTRIAAWTRTARSRASTEYRRRVVGDIMWAKQTMSEQIPGFTPWCVRRSIR